MGSCRYIVPLPMNVNASNAKNSRIPLATLHFPFQIPDLGDTFMQKIWNFGACCVDLFLKSK